MSHFRHFLAFVVILFLFGCGGGSGGGGGVGGAEGSPPPNVTPPVDSTTIRLQSVLERRVPAAVTHLRLTGFDSRGQIRYGPQTKPKAVLIDFEFVPTSVTRIQVEYLQDGRVLGIGLRDVVLVAGQIAVFVDLEFTDVDAALVRISIEPASLTLARGTTGQLRAVGHYDDSSVLDLSNSVTWNASNGNIDIEDNGSVIASSVGTTLVTATLGSRSASADVTVTAARLDSLRFEPASASIAKGLSQRFVVRGIFSDGTTQDLTEDVSFTITDPAVATVASPSGTVVGRSPGRTELSASFEGINAQAVLTITSATLSRIDVTPQNISFPKGTSQQYIATGVFSDQTTQDLTQVVTWRAEHPTLLNLTPEGLARGLSAGTTTVLASYQGKTGGTQVTVSPAALINITISPPTTSLPKGLTLQLTVTGHFSDDTTRDMTSDAVFESDSSAVSVNSLGQRGLVTAHQVGSANITASFGARQATARVTVTDAVLQSLTVSPPEQSLPVGLSLLYTASGQFSDGVSMDLSDQVDWSSLDGDLATIDSTGLAVALSAGEATLRASLDGVTGEAILTITPAVQSGLRVEPSELALSLQQSRQLTAYAVLTNGQEVAVASGVSWDSQAPTVVEVDSAGRATGRLEGATTVIATFSGFQATAEVEVRRRAYGDFITRREYPGFGGTGSLKLGDFNEDGAPDAVVATTSGLGFAAGDGEGGFLPAVAIQRDILLGQLVTGDFDNDGHLDAVAGRPEGSSGDPRLFLGDGEGGFTNFPVGSMGGASASLAAADFDGDGKLDLASVTPQVYGVSVRFGADLGYFGPLVTLDLPDVPFGGGRRLASGDVDGDGYQDIVAMAGSEIYLFRSLGDGTFSRVSVFSGLASYNGLQLADVNSDGRCDLVFVHTGPSVAVMLGNGDGTFGTPILTANDRSLGRLTLVDVDGDEILDAVSFSGGGSVNYLIWVQRGLGDGTFAPLAEINSAAGLVTFDVADLDGDGLADVVTQNGLTGRLGVTLHRSTGELKSVRVSPVEFGTDRLAVADFNEDGILDVAFSERIFFGDGTGLFAPVAGSGYLGFSGSDVVAEDLDGDGHADLLVSNSSSDLFIHYGAGDGTLQQFLRYTAIDRHYEVGLGDFNGDGRIDLAVNSGSDGLSVVLATGPRQYGEPTVFAIPYYSTVSREILVADLNSDGALDLALANRRVVSVLHGRGDGQFEPVVNYPAEGATGIAIADVDEDGDLDLLYTGDEKVVVLQNAGDGSFAVTFDVPTPYTARDVVAADLDLDGHVDIVTHVVDGATAAVHYGNGDGTFAPAVVWGVGSSRGVLLVEDFDGDGALDLATCGILVNNVTVILNAAFSE